MSNNDKIRQEELELRSKLPKRELGPGNYTTREDLEHYIWLVEKAAEIGVYLDMLDLGCVREYDLEAMKAMQYLDRGQEVPPDMKARIQARMYKREEKMARTPGMQEQLRIEQAARQVRLNFRSQIDPKKLEKAIYTG